MTTNALELTNLGVQFGGIHAVRDVTLQVAAGERRAVLGPNGAGKSSLFNLVAGEYAPTSGNIRMFGREVTRLPIYKRSRLGLGRTYQTSALFPHLSILQHLYLAVRGCNSGRMSLRPLKKSDTYYRQAQDLAQRVGLFEKGDHLVSSVSHGEQRQLEIGLALAGEPRLVLLDEPAAGLSQGERARLVSLLKALPKDLTLMIIEHDMDVALEVADLITVMHDGKVFVTETPADLRQNREIHALYLGKRE